MSSRRGRTLDDLRLEPNERAALEELRSRLRGAFGDRLGKLVLFGSKARGEAGGRSDIDVVAVVRGFDRSAEGDAVSSLRAQIDLQYGVFLEVLAYSESEYTERLGQQWPLFTDVESEGVALHGSVSGRKEPTTPANRRLQAGVLMERARRGLRSAESMFSLPDLQTAASSQACVAVLRAAEAVLAAKGLGGGRAGSIARGGFRSKGRGAGSALVAAFEEEVVKAGEVRPRFAKLLSDARQRRIACAYDVTHEETKEAAGSMLGNARAFIAAAEKRLKIETGKLR